MTEQTGPSRHRKLSVTLAGAGVGGLTGGALGQVADKYTGNTGIATAIAVPVGVLAGGGTAFFLQRRAEQPTNNQAPPNIPLDTLEILNSTTVTPASASTITPRNPFSNND